MARRLLRLDVVSVTSWASLVIIWQLTVDSIIIRSLGLLYVATNDCWWDFYRLLTTVADGKREVSISDFFTGPRQTCLQPNEVLMGVKVPFSLEVCRQRV
jgi:FAD binding domain in molybdopterin dehydrogenase